MRRAEPATVPGLPESALPAGALAALPGAAPPAPWTCRVRALAWCQRARTPRFPWAGRPLPLAAVAFVDYLDTPVGPYHEVVAAAAVRRGPKVVGQVPFIAVDSPPSVLGGRVNWALPKTTASFDGWAAEGDGWSMRADPSRPGPAFPLRLGFTCTGPLGDYRVRMRATARPVLARTEAHGPQLTAWLPAARRPALLLEGTLEISAPG